MTEPITSFRGKYEFLSNFFPCAVTLHLLGEMRVFPSAEHGFQAAKALAIPGVSPEEQRKHVNAVWRQPTPGRAKSVGRRIPMDPVLWEKISSDIMYRVVTSKFENHASLREALLETGDAHLEEGNYWGDRIWGTVNGEGENRLGRILMQVRSHFRVSA